MFSFNLIGSRNRHRELVANTTAVDDNELHEDVAKADKCDTPRQLRAYAREHLHDERDAAAQLEGSKLCEFE